jgi:hypothetical protein
MLKTNKLLVLMGILGLSIFALAFSANASETVPGTFTTTGELATPEITVLGLYDSSGSLVSPGDNVTPNTRHSIRFELTNPTYAFDDMVITVAFFQSFNSGSRDDFDYYKDSEWTNIYGDAFVARFGYQNEDRIPLQLLYNNSYDATDVSWDDNWFNNPADAYNDVVEVAPTDKNFEFTVYCNMSKVASVYNYYYIGAFSSQGITGQKDRVATYASEGPYYTESYTEFDFTSTTLTWDLASGENFTDFDGSSESSQEVIGGNSFFFIANIDFYLEVWADTEWTATDPDNPTGPLLTADLVSSPISQQEFAIYVDGLTLDGSGNDLDYFDATSEEGINGNDYTFYLELNTENFQDGSYSGDIYLSVYVD